MPNFRQVPFYMVALTAIAVGFTALQPKGDKLHDATKTPEKGLVAAPQGLQTPEVEGPVQPLVEFFALGKEAAPESQRPKFELQIPGFGRFRAADEPKRPSYDWGKVEWRAGYEVRFLIATVPDPVDSVFAHMFDQTVEAMQRALETEGYVRDRAWLPWNRQSKTPSPASDKALHRDHPGVILFRQTQGVPSREAGGHLIVACLVGETPQEGIHKVAFANSVKWARALAESRGDSGREQTLRAIGPFFSGSHRTLQVMLERTRAELWPGAAIRVVAGGGSSFDRTKFCEHWRGQNPRDSFSATTLPESLVTRWLYKYMANPSAPGAGDRPQKLTAILRESNTGFGQMASMASRFDAAPNDKLIDLPFPIHISRARSEYTRKLADQIAALGGRPRSGIPLPDAGEGGTEEQPYAPEMTAAQNEKVIANILATIAGERARYVGLIATDVRDKLFLAGLIHDRCPDVQFFTTGADLLLTHEDFLPATRGMLVGSTYPLNLLNQRWCRSKNDSHLIDRLTFANANFQGYYNATLEHFGSTSANLLDSGVPVGNGGRELTESKRPAVWISVVGSGGQLIPIYHVPPHEIEAHLQTDDPLERDFVLTSAPEKESAVRLAAYYPSLWMLLFFSLTGVVVYLVLVAGRRWLRANRVESVDWPERRTEGRQSAGLAVACTAMAVMYLVLFWLSSHGLRLCTGQPFLNQVLAWGFCLGTWTMGAFLLYQAYAEWRACRQERGGGTDEAASVGERDAGRLGRYLTWASARRWDDLGLAFVALAVGGFLYLTCLVVYEGFAPPEPDEQVRRAITFERWVHLANGVSPVIAIGCVCASLFAWGMFYAKACYLARRFAVLSPFDCRPGMPRWTDRRYLDLAELDRRLFEELIPPGSIRRNVALYAGLSIALLACFLRLREDILPTLEGWWFDWLVFGGFGLATVFLCFTLCRFWLAWRQALRLLRALALLPLGRAFDRLPDKVLALFGNYFFTTRPGHTHLAIAAHQYRLMDLCHGHLMVMANDWLISPDDVTRLEQTFPRTERERVLALLPGGLDLSGEEAVGDQVKCDADIAKATHQTAQNCLEVLRTTWDTQPLAQVYGRPAIRAEEHPPEVPPTPAAPSLQEWNRLAEEFVAIELIRYLNQIFAHLRNVLTSLTVGSLLLLLAAMAYPFHPQSLLITFLLGLTGAVSVAIVVFLVQLNRDEVISRIARSSPNRFTPDAAFLNAMVTYVLPIVGAVSFQIPVVSDAVRSLLEPILHVLR